MSIEPGRLVLEGLPGSGLRGVLRIHYLREEGDAPLRLDKRRCRFGALELVHVDALTHPVPAPAGAIHREQTDSLLITLAGPENLAIGEHRQEIELVFRGDVPPQRVPVTLRVKHPLRPRLARLFCGGLKPGQRWSLEVDLVRQPEATVAVQSVECDAAFLQARLLERDRLHVEVTAPAAEGRFEGRVLLRYSDPSIPEIALPVSGAVRVE